MDDDRVFQRNILIVRHLPSSLDVSNRVDVLKHFGAVNVKCMSDNGRMRHTAFATFEDHNAASQALHQLHQLNVMGHTLTAEFVKKRRQSFMETHDIDSNYRYQEDGNINGDTTKKDTTSDSFSVVEWHKKKMENTTGMATDFGILHPINPRLKYHYPPPTVSILSNIVNALASVPKFYVQTLHLMNKMNLPAPFGPLTPAPPLDDDVAIVPPEPDDISPGEMDVSSSSEESELESDEETREQTKNLAQQLVHATKRPLRKKAVGQRKCPRLQGMIATAPVKSAATSTVAPGGVAVPRGEVFDCIQSAVGKKFEIKVAESITSAVESQSKQDNQLLMTMPAKVEVSGFGTFQPANHPGGDDVVEEEEKEEEDEEDEEEGTEPSEFITRELLKRKLSKGEMKHISVFKNYSSGDPTTRLYVKNLAKQVEEKDLRFIYGRYVDWTSPMDKDMFNIQLMKQGRMKGQAFVGLPSELAAQKALKDTNGFILHNKPIVVSFARSAKPKEKEDPKEKKKPVPMKPREARRI